MQTLYMRLSIFLLVTIIFGSFSIGAQVIASEKLDKVFSTIAFNCLYYPKEGQEEVDSLKINYSIEDYKKYKGYFDYLNAQLLYSSLDIDSSLYYVESAVSFFTTSENQRWLTKSQLLLGWLAEAGGLMEQAKINYYKTISLGGVKENGDLGIAYLGIARCKNALGESFQEDLDKGISLLKSTKVVEFALYAEFMEQFFNLSSIDSPNVLNRIAQEYLKLGIYDRAANSYKVIGSSFYARQQYDSAHFYCDKAIDISESYIERKLIIGALYQFKGVLYYDQKNYKIAEIYFSRSLELYKKNNQSNRMIYAYRYLHKINVAQNNFTKAYNHLNEYLKLVLETSSKEKVRLAKVLEINNKVDLMKSQLVKLKIEKKASEFILYLVVVITMIIIGGLGIYIFLYQKNKKAKIEAINKEFHNLLMGIGEKQLLEHRLKKGGKKHEDHEVPLITPQMVEEGDIGDSFESCYMETINLFTDAFPQLTKTEVRYSVMICLKLPIELIAKVQHVQTGSIRKAKQRIRTKLNVPDNLEDFLHEFREKRISDLAG